MGIGRVTTSSGVSSETAVFPMPDPAAIVGIDVSAARLDCYRLDDDRHWAVANTERGWRDLIGALRLNPPRLIVLEATGKRERGVVRALDEEGMTPVVVNPLVVRRFKEGFGKRAKTERVRPVPGPVSSVTFEELQELVARRTQLVKFQAQDLNHRSTSSASVVASVVESVDRMQEQVAKEIATVEALLEALLEAQVAANDEWQARVVRLMTVPGIGMVTATRLIAGLRELGTVSNRALAALVGVAPYADDSGTHQGRRRIAGGRHQLRHALFYATEGIVRWDPTLRAHYTQLKARGKLHKQAIIACLNRLLGILNVMERDQLTWQETKVGSGAFVPPGT
jgi:transposase